MLQLQWPRAVVCESYLALLSVHSSSASSSLELPDIKKSSSLTSKVSSSLAVSVEWSRIEFSNLRTRYPVKWTVHSKVIKRTSNTNMHLLNLFHSLQQPRDSLWSVYATWSSLQPHPQYSLQQTVRHISHSLGKTTHEEGYISFSWQVKQVQINNGRKIQAGSSGQ